MGAESAICSDAHLSKPSIIISPSIPCADLTSAFTLSKPTAPAQPEFFGVYDPMVTGAKALHGGAFACSMPAFRFMSSSTTRLKVAHRSVSKRSHSVSWRCSEICAAALEKSCNSATYTRCWITSSGPCSEPPRARFAGPGSLRHAKSTSSIWPRGTTRHRATTSYSD